VVGLVRLRRTRPDLPRPYRMWLYPVPAAVALVGWVFIFVTTDLRVIAFGVGILALGVVCFLVWSRHLRQWPFASGSFRLKAEGPSDGRTVRRNL
jgi:amino acid transporter